MPIIIPPPPPPKSRVPAESTLFAYFADKLTTEETTVKPYLKPLIAAITGLLKPTAEPSIGNIHRDPDDAVSAATGVALSAAMIAYLAAFIGIDEGEPLAHMAELIGGAVGYRELSEVQIGPLVRHGIAKVADMKAKQLFQQELPGSGEISHWHARGLIDRGPADDLLEWHGLHRTLRGHTFDAAYSSLNPRILMRLVDTDLFDDADIADELTFAGMRPASQHRFLRAAKYMATTAERKDLIAEIKAAYQAGILSDYELLTNVDSAEANENKPNLILAAAKWKLLIAETKMLELEYATMFKGGQLDDASYRGFLAGLRLQPAVIDIHAGLVEAQANVTLHRRDLADAARLEDQTKRDLRRTAMKSFETGLLDEAALTAALIVTGLTPTQTLAWVALASLEASGTAKWLFGLQLQPERAQLLRERVTALTDQRKRELITDTEYTQALKDLGIPSKYLNALRAAADALVSPRKNATHVVVETK